MEDEVIPVHIILGSPDLRQSHDILKVENGIANIKFEPSKVSNEHENLNINPDIQVKNNDENVKLLKAM